MWFDKSCFNYLRTNQKSESINNLRSLKKMFFIGCASESSAASLPRLFSYSTQ